MLNLPRARALARFPDLRFELEVVHQGVRSLALYYRSTVSGTVVEVLSYDELGRIVRGHAHNAVPP